MLEDERKLTNKINPESLDPNHVSRPTVEEPEEKSADYEDTPEFRKSLNMKVSQRVTPMTSYLRCIHCHVNAWTLDAPKVTCQKFLFSCALYGQLIYAAFDLEPIVTYRLPFCLGRIESFPLYLD